MENHNVNVLKNPSMSHKVKDWFWSTRDTLMKNTCSTYHKLYSRGHTQVPGVCSFCWNLKWPHKNCSCVTEFWVWIGNYNVEVWKSTEQKLHNIWRSVKFQNFSETSTSLTPDSSQEGRGGAAPPPTFPAYCCVGFSHSKRLTFQLVTRCLGITPQMNLRYPLWADHEALGST